MTGQQRVAAAVLSAVAACGAVGGSLARGFLGFPELALVATGLLFVVAGIVADARRADTVVGRLLALIGLAWLLSAALTTAPNRLLYTGGVALFPLGMAALGHLALVFPSGRTSSPLERMLVAAPYGLALFGIPVIDSGLLVAVLVTTATVLVVLVRRWSSASPVARRVLLPVLPGACLFAAVYVAGLMAELGLPSGLGERWAILAYALLAAAPFVLLGGLLRARLAQANVGGLVVELGQVVELGLSPAATLRDSLARALDDPTVEVAHWLADQEIYVDAGGRAMDLAVTDSGRSITVLERAGRRVGALVHDAALGDDPALLEAVAAAAGLALENERLHAEVLARLEEVRASRARIVQAADAARRRVERDLHDGAQQRLVNVSLALGMARAKVEAGAPPALKTLLDQAAAETRLALQDLRDLAQGIHPAVLTEAGLAAAMESLAERSPVPVEWTVELTVESSDDLVVESSDDLVVDLAGGDAPSTNGRPPPPVEAVAYFVVSESLANAAKHAHASAVSVRIERADGHLRVEVADDGVGGARVRPGSGLEGLADRVAALDGRFEVVSEPSCGTRVTVELPCR